MSILNSIQSSIGTDPGAKAYGPLPAVQRQAAATSAPVSKVTGAGVSPTGQAAKGLVDQKRELDAELAAANRRLAGDGQEVRFEYDRAASQLIVRLVEVSTSKVLRQYPSEEALRTARQVNSGKSIINLQV